MLAIHTQSNENPIIEQITSRLHSDMKTVPLKHILNMPLISALHLYMTAVSYI